MPAICHTGTCEQWSDWKGRRVCDSLVVVTAPLTRAYMHTCVCVCSCARVCVCVCMCLCVRACIVCMKMMWASCIGFSECTFQKHTSVFLYKACAWCRCVQLWVCPEHTQHSWAIYGPWKSLTYSHDLKSRSLSRVPLNVVFWCSHILFEFIALSENTKEVWHQFY